MNIKQANKIVEKLASGDYYSVDHNIGTYGEHFTVYVKSFGCFQGKTWANAIHQLETAIQFRSLRNRLPAPLAA